MIFWFSGTGNSKWVAEQIAKATGDRLVEIGAAITGCSFSYTLSEGEKIGFVFPVHSWGPAPIVVAFIKQLAFNKMRSETCFVYAVAVCGDDIGMTMNLLEKALPDGLKLKAGFSVQMPNNYILLPGFDTDPKSLELQKLAQARSRVAEISEAITERRGRMDVVTGSLPWLKTRAVYPLFKRFAMSDAPFKADTAKCNSCGKCVRKCPVGNITLENGTPHWGGKCQMCLACIHHCTSRAIEYGSISRKKGRYHHPDSK